MRGAAALCFTHAQPRAFASCCAVPFSVNLVHCLPGSSTHRHLGSHFDKHAMPVPDVVGIGSCYVLSDLNLAVQILIQVYNR